MQPPEITTEPIIGTTSNPCQAIKLHDGLKISDTALYGPYVVDFMGLAVLCRTATAAVELARLMAAENESATGH
jgi:hypothetical protein